MTTYYASVYIFERKAVAAVQMARMENEWKWTDVSGYETMEIDRIQHVMISFAL
jgi:hypothetical protein